MSSFRLDSKPRFAAALLMATWLVAPGCGYIFGEGGYFRDRALDYRQARNLEPLELPASLDGFRRQPAMPIPEARRGSSAGEQAEGFEAPRPKPLSPKATTGGEAGTRAPGGAR